MLTEEPESTNSLEQPLAVRRPTRRRYIIFIILAILLVAYGIFLIATSKHVPASSQQPTASSQAVASGVHKPYLTGLLNRNGPPDASLLTYAGKPLITGFVIPVNWKDVQPNGPADFNTTLIDQQLAFARQHNMGVRLRLYAGYNSPDWVKQQVGSVNWQGRPTEGGPSSYVIPDFWKAPFRDIWQAFNTKLAAQYDAEPIIRDVNSGMCITNFDEPFIRQFSVAQNVATAKANGYTDDTNNLCLQATIDTFKATWSKTSLSVTFNPFQSVSTAPGDAIIEPKAIADYCVSQLGSHCVLGNDSLESNKRSDDYDNLYTMMHTTGAPLYIQTATNARIGDWQKTLADAVDIGALDVELPVGYAMYDAAALQAFNARLQANTDHFNAK